MQRAIIGILICGSVLGCGAREHDEKLDTVSNALHDPNVNISNSGGAESEVGIAVDPTNRQNVVAVSNDIGDLSKLAVWFSTDGGATWTANFIDENEDSFGSGDRRFDPNVAYDSDGNVYVIYSTSGTGNRLVLARSTDGGQNFNQVTTVTTDAGTNNLHTAMVTTRADASGADDVLVVWARVQGNESIEAALSLDAGATFTVTNNNINDALQRTFLPWAEADANGDFAVVWEVNQGGGAGAIFHDTLDGTTLADGANNTVSTIQITDFAAATSKIPAQPDRGLFSVTTVGANRTTGRIFVSYSDRPNTSSNDLDVFVRFSDDGGANWSARVQVNDDGTTTSQFMPRLAVDHTDGTIYTIWYDARNDATNNQRVNLFGSFSLDGGASWSANHRLSDAESDESTANAARDGNNYGEYVGLTANGGFAHAGWTDARNANFTAGTNEDVYTTRFGRNLPPVAICQNVNAGADGMCLADASVNNGSFDPDGDAITCVQVPTGPYGLGATLVTLTCTDPSGASDSCQATVTVSDVTPPVIECPANQTAECIAGSATVDFGNATATDNCAVASVGCVPPSGSTFPLGNTPVSCTATDTSSNASQCGFNVAVVDTTPPVVTVGNGGTLWPPNHQYVPKSLDDCGIEINDLCQGMIDLADANPLITCVTSDEVENGQGDGNTTQDMVILNATTVNLRSERSGNLDGRVYKIHFRVNDAAGNVATGVCPVTVAHDQGNGSAAIDSGVHFSVGTCN